MAGWLLNRSDEIQDDKSHTANVDNTRFKEDFKQIQSQIEDTVKEYFKESKENKISDNKISEVIYKEICVSLTDCASKLK